MRHGGLDPTHIQSKGMMPPLRTGESPVCPLVKM